jgi:hypothetical protein
MKRHLVVGKFGNGDRASITKNSDEALTRLNFITIRKQLNYGIGNALVDLVKMGIFPSEIGIDLLIFAAHVQAADTHISRELESQDSWTREIRLVVPVSNLEKWNAALPVLKRALDFLTGDIWTISFRLRPAKFTRLVPVGSQKLMGIPFDALALFSGGLDSLVGAVDLLENGKNPLLISHVGDGATSDAQQNCFNKLKAYYSKNKFDRMRVWMNFRGLKISGNEVEKSTRGRSFLFFTLGVLAGTGFNSPFILQVSENGLIALNIPLDQLRLGSHSTHTTHPFYIARWNEILNILGINGKIENPYWNKTKGEMIEACANRDLLQQIAPVSLSCSSPTKGRWFGQGVQHCGYCLPCIIRRAAMEKGFGKNADTTKYTIRDLYTRALKTFKAEGQQIRSFELAIQKIKENPKLAQFIIHNSGSLSDESPLRQRDLANLYVRGMNEVDRILAGVTTVSR